jgi:integrase
MAKATKHYGGWRIRWTDESGKRKSAVYEDRRDAELELQRRQLETEERRRGLRTAATIPKTFDAIAAYWEQHRAPQKKRNGRDDVCILKRLREGFGMLSLGEPAAWLPAIDNYIASKSSLHRKTLSNHLTLLGSLLRLAVELGWMVRAPRVRKPKVRAINHDFSYLRTADEVARFLRAAMDEGEHVHALYITAVYTGARAGELAGLRWDDVDLERRLITIQRSFDGSTKADDLRYVPIVDALLPALRSWRLRHPGRLVFTNRDGGMLKPSGRVFQETLHGVLEQAGFPKVERNGKPRPYIRFHDLRHSFASHWLLNGGDLFKLQKILGHKTVAMTLRYAHLAPAAFRDDYARFGSGAANDCPVLQLKSRSSN